MYSVISWSWLCHWVELNLFLLFYTCYTHNLALDRKWLHIKELYRIQTVVVDCVVCAYKIFSKKYCEPLWLTLDDQFHSGSGFASDVKHKNWQWRWYNFLIVSLISFLDEALQRALNSCFKCHKVITKRYTSVENIFIRYCLICNGFRALFMQNILL